MARPSLTLYRGFPTSAAYTWSPFVSKLETRFRFAGLTYKTEQGAPPKGPRGKIPYLAISKNGNSDPDMVSDSALISEKLVADGLAEDLNAKLTAPEKAQDLALRALLEDKLYFYQASPSISLSLDSSIPCRSRGYERWEQNYYTLRAKVFAGLPYPVQVLVGQLAYRKMSATLYGQGTGRFTPEEITKFKTEIWENVNALLTASSRKRGSGGPDGLFFVLGGNGPTEADTTVYGFVAAGLVCAAAPETQKIVRSFPTIMDYADKIHKRYFSDYEHWE